MTTALDVQYVIVQLGQEKYALRIHDVYEIIKMQKITEIPNGRQYMLGAINLRGRIVPVISLRKRFGLPEVPVTRSTRIVIVNVQEDTIGIVVDGVNKITTFTDIQPITGIVSEVDGNFFEGIGQSEEDLISILKIDRVLCE